MAITEAEFELANERMNELRVTTPFALQAWCSGAGEIMLSLSTGVTLSFPYRKIRELEEASPPDLLTIEISPSGLGLHFPKIDVDLYLPSLIEQFIGPRNWRAARLGGSGGKSRSPVKQKAARENGRLGGRPKKAAVPDL
jgi:hypothetical protein